MKCSNSDSTRIICWCTSTSSVKKAYGAVNAVPEVRMSRKPVQKHVHLLMDKGFQAEDTTAHRKNDHSYNDTYDFLAEGGSGAWAPMIGVGLRGMEMSDVLTGAEMNATTIKVAAFMKKNHTAVDAPSTRAGLPQRIASMIDG